MAYKKINKKDVTTFSKSDVDMFGYGELTKDISMVKQVVKEGHFEEFIHDKSTFIYIFLEGNGTFVLDDEKVEVSSGDVLIIEPGTRIYYYGNLKQILITSPSYDSKYERHIRNVDKGDIK